MDSLHIIRDKADRDRTLNFGWDKKIYEWDKKRLEDGTQHLQRQETWIEQRNEKETRVETELKKAKI